MTSAHFQLYIGFSFASLLRLTLKVIAGLRSIWLCVTSRENKSFQTLPALLQPGEKPLSSYICVYIPPEVRVNKPLEALKSCFCPSLSTNRPKMASDFYSLLSLTEKWLVKQFRDADGGRDQRLSCLSNLLTEKDAILNEFHKKRANKAYVQLGADAVAPPSGADSKLLNGSPLDNLRIAATGHCWTSCWSRQVSLVWTILVISSLVIRIDLKK